MIYILDAEWTEGSGYFLGPVNIAKQQGLLLNNNIKGQKIVIINHAQDQM